MIVEHIVKSLNELELTEQFSVLKDNLPDLSKSKIVDLITYFCLTEQSQQYEYILENVKLENVDYLYILSSMILNRSKYWIIKDIAKLCTIDHTQDDILYMVFFYKNKEALDAILEESNISVDTIKILKREMKLIKEWSDEGLIKLELLMFSFDLNDAKNPRNLIYAISSMMNCEPSRKNRYYERALKLIKDGVRVDIWNNYILKLLLIDYKPYMDKKENETLVKEILKNGGMINNTIKAQIRKSK